MKSFKIAFFLLVASTTLTANTYRCMIQMNAYKGESAYVVASLINPQGKYERTLAILGPDKKWWDSLTEWYKAQQVKAEKLDAISGASIKGGDRRIISFTIDDKIMNKGYKLRFESSVEDQKYVVDDVEIPLTTAQLTTKANGKTYIKLVKINKAN
ncbi:MAG: flagellin biosynthesis protein FlgD [Paludibacter sp. 47-17]|nr:MAG: flagellin biosynthesis protein FlgD [Paludibacter sp. SCN 50-10]OJX88833.1 MAG: flagellin biosynthesis protein FlgD [Paludibacter sp. 47-17]